MGFWWELLQQYQIGNRRRETTDLNDQVANLQERVQDLEDVISRLLTELDNQDSPTTEEPIQ